MKLVSVLRFARLQPVFDSPTSSVDVFDYTRFNKLRDRRPGLHMGLIVLGHISNSYFNFRVLKKLSVGPLSQQFNL